jgi:hypothetical protein
LNTARSALPEIASPPGEVKPTSMSLPPNKLQRSLVSAEAVRRGHDPIAVLARTRTRDQARSYLTTH